jgi:hypothetical protein
VIDFHSARLALPRSSYYAAAHGQAPRNARLPARYYRQKAVEARQAAEEATMRAIKDRLHGSARDFGKLAAAAELGKQQTRLGG